MDKKKILSIFFLIVAIIIIAIMGYYIYKFYNEKQLEIEKGENLTNKVSSIEDKENTTQETLQNTLNLETNTISTSENIEKIDSENEKNISVSYIILSIEDIEAEERNKQGIEEKSIKITNEQKIDSLMEIINNAKPYQEKSFIPDFGDCPPSAEIYLSNGEKYTISAGDNISDAGEEVNLMAKWDTEDGSNKLLYKVDIELGKYIEELFAEEENG